MPAPLRIATGATSMYHQCVAILRHTQSLPLFSRYVQAAQSDPSLFANALSVSTPDVHDPVSLLWNTLRLGESLCYLFNLTRPKHPIELASAKTDGDILQALASTNAMKAQVYHFLVGCRSHLHMREDELFTITELYQDDTNGFVKVTRTVTVLLEKLELLGCLPPVLSLSPASSPASAVSDGSTVGTPTGNSFFQSGASTSVHNPAGSERRSSLRQSMSAHDVALLQAQQAQDGDNNNDEVSDSPINPSSLHASYDQSHSSRFLPKHMQHVQPPSLESMRASSTSVLPIYPSTSNASGIVRGNTEGSPSHTSFPTVSSGQQGVQQQQQQQQIQKVPVSNRDKVLHELLETERKYVSDLEYLQTYMKYLIEHNILLPDQIPLIFANLNALVDFQRKFLILLESIVASGSNTSTANATDLGLDIGNDIGVEIDTKVGDTTSIVGGRIGALFEQLEKQFHVYEIFCANYKTAADLVLDQAPILQKASNIVEPTYELPSLLIKPIQRVCRYPLLLNELLKQTTQDRQIHGLLQRGLDAVKRVTDRVNETRRQQENGHVRDELERRIEDWKGHNIGQFGELLLFDKFTMMIQDIERELSIFLFDKIILCCKETAPNPIAGMSILKRANRATKKKDIDEKSNYGYQIKGRIWVGSVTNVVGESTPGKWTLKVNWKSVEMDSFALKCRNEEQLKLWQTSLQRCITRVEEKRRRLNISNESSSTSTSPAVGSGSTPVLATSHNNDTSGTGTITGFLKSNTRQSRSASIKPPVVPNTAPSLSASLSELNVNSPDLTLTSQQSNATARISRDWLPPTAFNPNMNLNDNNLTNGSAADSPGTHQSANSSVQPPLVSRFRRGSSGLRSNQSSSLRNSDDGIDFQLGYDFDGEKQDDDSFLDSTKEEDDLYSKLTGGTGDDSNAQVLDYNAPLSYDFANTSDAQPRRVHRSKSALDMAGIANLRPNSARVSTGSTRSHQSYATPSDATDYVDLNLPPMPPVSEYHQQQQRHQQRQQQQHQQHHHQQQYQQHHQQYQLQHRSHSSTPPPVARMVFNASAPTPAPTSRPPLKPNSSISTNSSSSSISASNNNIESMGIPRGTSPQTGPPSPTFRRKASVATLPYELAYPNMPPPIASLPPLPSQDLANSVTSSGQPVPPPKVRGSVPSTATPSHAPLSALPLPPAPFLSRPARRTSSTLASTAARENYAGGTTPVQVKLHHQNDVHLLVLPKDMLYRDLVVQLYRKINNLSDDSINRDDPPRMRVKYQDEDGDFIIIRSDEDVKMAFEGTFLSHASETAKTVTVDLFVTL